MCKSISWQWTPLIVEKYKSYLFEMCWALIEHKHLDSGYWPIFLFLQAKMFILKICKHASSAIPLCELNVGPVISIFTDLLKFQIKHSFYEIQYSICPSTYTFFVPCTLFVKRDNLDMYCFWLFMSVWVKDKPKACLKLM